MTKLIIPDKGFFSIKVDISIAADPKNAEIKYEELLCSHLESLDRAGIDMSNSSISANPKVVDMLTVSNRFERSSVDTEVGLRYVGRYTYSGFKSIKLAETEIIPGARIVTSRGIITYIFDHIE